MSTELQALLDAMQARCDAATDGPWSATHGPHELPRIWSDAPQYEDAEFIAKCSMRDDLPDAEFIAAARQDLPRLIAAVWAVLEMHPALAIGCITHYARSDCECEPRFICAQCTVTHPCTTVAAIRSALIGGDDGAWDYLDTFSCEIPEAGETDG
ncbi:hypothetical protein [Tessaracoccus massiliensis]|uniref:hypothetical protein n=1 Tax=Tessaracoccus massiliensis TaxID=1522311 RepID=UPI000590B23D|nr:hypothetical protein [Tessaracoccus massiliensis]